MNDANEITVSLAGGRRVDVDLGAHVIHTDQPLSNGGEDTAATPFQLFLASIGACAGVFVQGFLSKRGLSTEGVRIVERPSFDANGTLAAVALRIELPQGFPEKYREAVARVVEQCSVKRAIAAQPRFDVDVHVAPEHSLTLSH